MIASVLFVLCGGSIFLFFPSLVDPLLKKLYVRNPIYDGMYLLVDADEVYCISLGDPQPLPGSFYLLVDGIPKNLSQCTRQDFSDLSFDAVAPDVYRYGVSPFFDRVSFKSDQVSQMSLELGNVKFSSSPDGPFLGLPVSFTEFKKQFGEPQRYSRGGGREWHGP